MYQQDKIGGNYKCYVISSHAFLLQWSTDDRAIMFEVSIGHTKQGQKDRKLYLNPISGVY